MAASDMPKLVCVTCSADSPCEQAFGVWQERRPDISEEELERASSAMGYGAVKYADLKNNRMTNYTYAWLSWAVGLRSRLLTPALPGNAAWRCDMPDMRQPLHGLLDLLHATSRSKLVGACFAVGQTTGYQAMSRLKARNLLPGPWFKACAVPAGSASTTCWTSRATRLCTCCTRTPA